MLIVCWQRVCWSALAHLYLLTSRQTEFQERIPGNSKSRTDIAHVISQYSPHSVGVMPSTTLSYRSVYEWVLHNRMLLTIFDHCRNITITERARWEFGWSAKSNILKTNATMNINTVLWWRRLEYRCHRQQQSALVSFYYSEQWAAYECLLHTAAYPCTLFFVVFSHLISLELVRDALVVESRSLGSFGANLLVVRAMDFNDIIDHEVLSREVRRNDGIWAQQCFGKRWMSQHVYN
jgi:hypothetical protein